MREPKNDSVFLGACEAIQSYLIRGIQCIIVNAAGMGWYFDCFGGTKHSRQTKLGRVEQA